MTLRQSHGQQHRVIGKVFLSPYPTSLSHPLDTLTPPSPQSHLDVPLGRGRGKIQSMD